MNDTNKICACIAHTFCHSQFSCTTKCTHILLCFSYIINIQYIDVIYQSHSIWLIALLLFWLYTTGLLHLRLGSFITLGELPKWAFVWLRIHVRCVYDKGSALQDEIEIIRGLRIGSAESPSNYWHNVCRNMKNIAYFRYRRISLVSSSNDVKRMPEVSVLLLLCQCMTLKQMARLLDK